MGDTYNNDRTYDADFDETAWWTVAYREDEPKREGEKPQYILSNRHWPERESAEAYCGWLPSCREAIVLRAERVLNAHDLGD